MTMKKAKTASAVRPTQKKGMSDSTYSSYRGLSIDSWESMGQTHRDIVAETQAHNGVN
jgi:hypothetical protein